MTLSGVERNRAAAWSAPLWGLARAEFRKIASTHSWWALLLPAGAFCAFIGLLVTAFGGLISPPPMLAFALGSYATKFAAIFGVVCASTEFRHRTATTSYLTAPDRPRLLLAKAVVAGLVGAGYGVVCAVLVLLGMLVGGDRLDGAGTDTLWSVSLVAVVLFACWAVIGVGVGALVANQVAAVVGLLLYLVFGELLITAFSSVADLGPLDEFLPGGATSATLNNLAGNGLSSRFGADSLPWWLSLVILLGYTAVALLASAAVAQSRDVT